MDVETKVWDSESSEVCVLSYFSAAKIIPNEPHVLSAVHANSV
jgi:hypothetical protein